MIYQLDGSFWAKVKTEPFSVEKSLYIFRPEILFGQLTEFVDASGEQNTKTT